VDDRGEAIYALGTQPGDPWGWYHIRHDGAGRTREAGSGGDLGIGPAGGIPPAESPLKRSDAPPAGLAPRLPRASESPIPRPEDWPCLGEPLRPGRHAELGTMELLVAVRICLDGFEPNREAQIRYVARARPNSATVPRVQVGGDGSGADDFWPTPGDALGEYSVTATQGPNTATGSFAVRAASEPRVSHPRALVPGDEIAVTLAGFQPRQRVELHLYRRADGDRCPDAAPCWSYAASWPSTLVNERGEREDLRLPTEPDDPEGEYLLVTAPSAASPTQGRFEVRACSPRC
jgi:hypothetical protein